MVTRPQIAQAVQRIAKENGALLALLFGSFARQTATRRSDVDLIFVEATTDSFLQRIDRYLEPLVTQLGTAVDVFVYTPQEFEQLRSGAFLRRALDEGVILYERRDV